MAVELRSEMNRQQMIQNKEEKVFTVQMLKVLFIRTYFSKNLLDHKPKRNFVCQSKLTKTKFKIKVSKSSRSP